MPHGERYIGGDDEQLPPFHPAELVGDLPARQRPNSARSSDYGRGERVPCGMDGSDLLDLILGGDQEPGPMTCHHQTDCPKRFQGLENAPVCTIEYGKSRDGRARKIVSRSRARPTGKYPGFKSGRMHHWESPIDRDVFWCLDALPEVKGFREQPMRLDLRDAFGTIRHFPDLEILLKERKLLVEVKGAQEARTEEVAARTERFKDAMPWYGYDYVVITNEQLTANPLILRNARFLLRYGRHPLSKLEIEAFRRYLAGPASLRWRDLKSGDAIGLDGIQAICNLCLTGRIAVNLRQPLNEQKIAFVDALSGKTAEGF